MPEDAEQRSGGSGGSRRSPLRARSARWVRSGPWALLASIPAGMRAGIVITAAVGGWIVLALWLGATRSRFDGDEGIGLAWMMLACGIVGTVQPVVVVPREPSDRRRARTALGVIGLVLAHIGVVLALVGTIVPAPERFDAGADVLILGFFGWILGPLLLMVGMGAVLMAFGLGREGVRSVSSALAPDVPSRCVRVHLLSKCVALFGCAGLVLFFVMGVPGSGGAMHGIGSAVVFAVELLLQAVHVLQGPPGWFFRADRIGYLLSVLAIAQFAPTALLARMHARRGGPGEGERPLAGRG